MTLSNWAGNTTFRAKDVHHPTSLDELRRLVAASARVRALGSGHSFNGVADTTGDLVVLDRMPELVEIDSAAATVRVGARMTYATLAPLLHQAGFALANLASLPHISVAGSVATGTHGSGDAVRGLAAAVSGIELVTADGSLLSLSRGDADFPGAVVSVGALGVVTSLTLDLVPAFELRQYVREGLSPDALAHFDEIMSSGYSVSLFTDYRDTRVWLKREEELTTPDWYGTTPADGPRHPLPAMPADSCTGQLGVPGPWYERLPHFRADYPPSGAGDELQSELLLPRQHAVKALRELFAIGDRIRPVLQISEVRSIAADDLWLSPFNGRDSVGIHFTWVKDVAAVMPVLKLVEETLAPFGPIPHWGKLFTRWPECPGSFRSLVDRLDPAGKFANDFTRVLLGE
ncbi:FAD-binding protein [Nonomuraea gerenzanensis]|uniref:FAD-binding protein n=1 Tax=Nonomuraea gerenzanensis TaxID=93944 RepID=UPI001CD98480|nr:FAD-binding protein [Nonomuraea gerenzanensis]UBU11079.1 FAD-binding protein [Nonomuraea gerenzanensis]